jgi:hypothetical protein
MLLRWSGYADLTFAESAWLAFARAAELGETDVHEQHREAWVIDDRRVVFALDTESSRVTVEAMKRFLGLLALQAAGGEATIEIAEPREVWVRRACAPSFPEGLESECPPESRTLRAAASSEPPSGSVGSVSELPPWTTLATG